MNHSKKYIYINSLHTLDSQDRETLVKELSVNEKKLLNQQKRISHLDLTGSHLTYTTTKNGITALQRYENVDLAAI